jgi:DNA-binding NarL/FixJ family response regulator
MSPIRVVVADDHTLLRAGIRAMLAPVADIELIAEANDGQEALDLVAAHRPHVLLTDIAMPRLNGVEVTARVVKEFPHVRVIILSMYATEEHVCHALRAGAAGYLLKTADASELQFAIQAVARGEIYLTPAISRHVVNEYLRRTVGETGPLELLTPRQREILQLVAEGRSLKEIAGLLQISVKTVETHRTQLMERLGIHDVAGLVRFAIRTGVVQPQT